MSGYTLSYRDKWQHPVFRNLREAGMWSWLCDTAVWKKTKVRFNGVLVELDRGKLATSIRFMSNGFEIGEQLTRTFLQNLEKEGMINTRPTHWGTIVTICNYDRYQLLENADNTHVNTRPTHAQHTPNTNKNKDNTGNKDNEFIYEIFKEFWKIYPKARAGSKEKALAAFTRKAEKHGSDVILSAVKKYATSEEVAKGFAKGCAAWLNDDRFLSVYPPAKEEEKRAALIAADEKQKKQVARLEQLMGINNG